VKGSVSDHARDYLIFFIFGKQESSAVKIVELVAASSQVGSLAIRQMHAGRKEKVLEGRDSVKILIGVDFGELLSFCVKFKRVVRAPAKPYDSF
jgi:hypothetical protein